MWTNFEEIVIDCFKDTEKALIPFLLFEKFKKNGLSDERWTPVIT